MIAEALVPIFFVMFLGYFAGAKRIINNQHLASLMALLLTFAVPVAAFVGIAQTSRSGLEENGKLVFVLVISMLVIFGITFALNHFVFRLNEVVSHALNLIGATTARLACFVTGLVLSAQPLRLNANVGVCVFLKNIGLPLVAYAIALALGMSGQIARETILLATLPAGFVGILFGLNYGIRSQALGSTLTLSSLVSVITLTAAIFLTSQMK